MNPDEQPSEYTDRDAPEAWVEREPATQPTQSYSQNHDEPQPTTSSQPVMPVATQPTRKKSRTLRIVLILIGALLLITALLVGLFVYEQSSHPVTKTPTVVPKAPDTSLLSAYTSADQKNLIIKAGDKTITTQPLPEGKTALATIAANDKFALLLATNGASDTEPAGMLVLRDGRTNTLTPSIAASVQSSTSFARNYGALDRDGHFLRVECQQTSCVMSSLDLTSGSVTPVLTQGYTPAATSSTSLALLGISNDNVAYVAEYAKNNVADPVGTIVALDLSSGAVKKSLIMPKAAAAPATFSPDFSYALFTQSQDNATANLIKWQDGQTTQITGAIASGQMYLWSPDSKRALFLNNPAGQTSTLGVITTSSDAQTILKTFATNANTKLIIRGWTSTTTIQYDLTQTGATATHTYNVDTGEDTVLANDAARLVPIEGTALTSN